MKILFLNPPFNMVTEENGTSNYSPYGDRVLPYSLLVGAAFFKERSLDVFFFDPGLHRRPDTSLYRYFSNLSPDIVLTTLNCLAIPQTAQLLRDLKRMHSFSAILLCNEPFIEEMMSCFECGDFFIINDWIPAAYDLCRSLSDATDIETVKGIFFRKNGTFFYTGDRVHVPVRTLPLPALEIAETKKYNHQQILLSEGCNYRCFFCHFGNRIKEGWSAKPVERCIEELRLLRLYGKKFIRIIDNELTAQKDFIKELLQRIIDLRLDIVWEVNVRVNNIDESTASLMSRAGCIQVGFGVESGVQSVLDANNKQISLEQIIEAVRLFKKYKILTRAYFLIGLRGDTERTIRETLRFLKNEVIPDSAGFSLVIPYPGTDYHHYLKDAGYLKSVSSKQVCWIYKHLYGMTQIDDQWTEKPDWRYEHFDFYEMVLLYKNLYAEVAHCNEKRKIKTLMTHGLKYSGFLFGQMVMNPYGIVHRLMHFRE